MDAIADVVAKPLSLQEIRAKIEKARDRKYHRRVDDVKLEIEQLQQKLDLESGKENSSVEHISREMKEKAEYETALKEATEYKDYLAAGGEDPEQIIKGINIKIASLDSSIENQRTKLAEVQRNKAELGRRITALRVEVDKIEAAQKADSVRKPEERDDYVSPMTAKSLFYYKAVYQKILRQLPGFKQEIQNLFREVEMLPKKLDCYSHDQNARMLFVMNVSATAKIILIERCHDFSMDELEAVKQMINAMRGMARMYAAGVIESLANGERPRRFMSWKEFSLDAKRQMENYFDPKKVEERKANPSSFGVVTPAPSTPEPTMQMRQVMPVKPIVRNPPSVMPEHVKQAIKAIGQDTAAEMILDTILPKPKNLPIIEKSEEIVRKESLERRIARIVKESGVTKKTAGLRVAILAGQADKNKPLIGLFEDAFEFKRVRWYDNNTGHLLDSIKIGGIDLLIAIPEWHKGYMQYVQAAKAKGIDTEIMASHNKRLMTQQICAHYGVNLEISEE